MNSRIMFYGRVYEFVIKKGKIRNSFFNLPEHQTLVFYCNMLRTQSTIIETILKITSVERIRDTTVRCALLAGFRQCTYAPSTTIEGPTTHMTIAREKMNIKTDLPSIFESQGHPFLHPLTHYYCTPSLPPTALPAGIIAVPLYANVFLYEKRKHKVKTQTNQNANTKMIKHRGPPGI